MLYPLSLNTKFKTIDNYVFRYKNGYIFEWRKPNVKFNDNSTKLTLLIHSIIKQSMISKINDYDIDGDGDYDDFFIITIIILQIHLIRLYNQNQILLSINNFVLELLHAADLIFHFHFLVRFKFIIEIYYQILYNKKLHSVLLFLSFCHPFVFPLDSVHTFHFEILTFCMVIFK